MRSKKLIASKQKTQKEKHGHAMQQLKSNSRTGKEDFSCSKSSLDKLNDQNGGQIIELKSTSQLTNTKKRSISDIDKQTLAYLQNALKLRSYFLSSKTLAFIFNIEQKMMNSLINKYKTQGCLIKRQCSQANFECMDKLQRPMKLTVFIQRLIQILKLEPNIQAEQIQRIYQKYYNCTTNQATIVRYIGQINQMKEAVTRRKLSKVKLKTQ